MKENLEKVKEVPRRSIQAWVRKRPIMTGYGRS